MGTRADFYVGRGEQAEWLGSIAWDGYPDGVGHPNEYKVIHATTEEQYRTAVEALLMGESEHATRPAMGWPWPWKSSSGTDYAYAFQGNKVYASNFGSDWFDPLKEQPEGLKDDAAEFPDVSGVQNVTFGDRSGAIFFSGSSQS